MRPGGVVLVVLAGGMFACGGSANGNSTFNSTTERADGGIPSARGQLLDHSIVAGPCIFEEPDATPVGTWTCPPGQYCVVMTAFAVPGENCRDDSCPVCLTVTDLSPYVKCDEPNRRPFFLLTNPPRAECTE
jgi:hypothetical protein